MPPIIDAEYEATVARAMLAEIEAYLESDVVFWQAAPNALGARMPLLSIGALLESLLRAEAGGAADARSMASALETVKTRRRARFLDRAEKETGSRLDAWSWYLDDYARAPGDSAAQYASEVRSRFKAELLLNQLEPEGRGRAGRSRAAAIDERVRASFASGEFIWDERMKPLLAPDRYWWLYGRLHTA